MDEKVRVALDHDAAVAATVLLAALGHLRDGVGLHDGLSLRHCGGVGGLGLGLLGRGGELLGGALLQNLLYAVCGHDDRDLVVVDGGKEVVGSAKLHVLVHALDGLERALGGDAVATPT